MLPAEVDVVVLGSGAGGLAAAVTVAAKGCSVLLLEKAEVIGGTMAWSGGGVWIPTNHRMAEAGVNDTQAEALRYIEAVTGNHFDAEMARAFISNGAEAIAFLESLGPWVRFTSYAGSDYHPDLPGAAPRARSMLPLPFEGRDLGEWLGRLRRPKPEMSVFGGLQIETSEISDFQNVFRSARSLAKVVKRVGGYAKDLLRHGRGTKLIRGNALAAALLRTALDKGVDVRTGVTVTRLDHDDGRVTGVAVRTSEGERTVRARRGVVLATGGFSAHAEARNEHLPAPRDHLQLLPDENTGDGLALGRSIGAVLGGQLGSNAIFAPASSRAGRNGKRRVYPHFAFDRCKPGSMLVDAAGRRFANEAQSYHTLVKRMHAGGISPAWLIADHRFLRKYGMGLARPAPHPYRYLLREGYLIAAPTLAALANKIGIDADGLSESAERMNRFADAGVDEEFSKGGDIYTRALGDPDHRPNPCLGRIEQGPFYALPLFPTDAGTSLGLAINSEGAVLGADSQPVPGLYAAGLDAHAAMRGYYPGAGTQIGQAIAFGYAAGRALARP